MTTEQTSDQVEKKWCGRCRKFHFGPFLTADQLIDQITDRLAQEIADEIDKEILDEIRKANP